MTAAERTDSQLRALDTFCGQVEDAMHADSRDTRALIIAIGLATGAIVAALREVALHIPEGRP